MTQDLLQLISNEMKGFSKGQKRIGAFILEHYDKAAFMTAANSPKTGYIVGSNIYFPKRTYVGHQVLLSYPLASSGTSTAWPTALPGDAA